MKRFFFPKGPFNEGFSYGNSGLDEEIPEPCITCIECKGVGCVNAPENEGGGREMTIKENGKIIQRTHLRESIAKCPLFVARVNNMNRK